MILRWHLPNCFFVFIFFTLFPFVFCHFLFIYFSNIFQYLCFFANFSPFHPCLFFSFFLIYFPISYYLFHFRFSFTDECFLKSLFILVPTSEWIALEAHDYPLMCDFSQKLCVISNSKINNSELNICVGYCATWKTERKKHWVCSAWWHCDQKSEKSLTYVYAPLSSSSFMTYLLKHATQKIESK